MKIGTSTAYFKGSLVPDRLHFIVRQDMRSVSKPEPAVSSVIFSPTAQPNRDLPGEESSILVIDNSPNSQVWLNLRGTMEEILLSRWLSS
jgi:hypothetical protein